jgi:hypothetical protein
MTHYKEGTIFKWHLTSHKKIWKLKDSETNLQSTETEIKTKENVIFIHNGIFFSHKEE